MFKLIETLRSKPSDRNIRIIRIVFALILLGVIYFGFGKTYFEYTAIPREILYGLYIFPVIGLIRGIFDFGIMRKKLWKWTQVSIGGVLLMLSWFLIETDTVTETPLVETGSISAATLERSPSEGVIDTDFWIGFLGFWLTLVGLTLASKNITKKNERYGEIVKKIRV
jgi:hypothetical protein